MASTSVRDWYKGKNVFVTGASGFLGIALLEKLLRTIPELGDVYLLLRPKKGKEIHERLDEIKKNLIFEKLYETRSQDEVKRSVRDGVIGMSCTMVKEGCMFCGLRFFFVRNLSVVSVCSMNRKKVWDKFRCRSFLWEIPSEFRNSCLHNFMSF